MTKGLEKTYKDIYDSFYQVYSSRILPRISNYENERKQLLIISIIIKIVSAIIFLFSGYKIFFSDTSIILMTVLFLFSIPGLFSNIIKKSFEGRIKNEIMPIVCKCLGNIQWKSMGYDIPSLLKIIDKSALIYTHGTSDCDDFFSGTYNDVKYDILELKKIGKYGISLFKGIVIRLDVNNKFNGHTVINQFGAVPIPTAENGWVSLQRIDLRNINIGNEYNVFTNNEAEARAFAALPFLEKLGNIKNVFNANRISCAFYEQNLLIAIHKNKDMFSICSLFKPMDDFKQYSVMFEELLSVLKLIDYLHLEEISGCN